MKRILFLGLIALSLMFAPLDSVFAQTSLPKMITYQGNLLDQDGDPLTDDVAVTFEIFDAETGGNKLWSEVHNVSVEDGYFNVNLGTRTSLDALRFNQAYYLQITVGNGQPYERTLMTPSPYSINAILADTATAALIALDLEDSIVTQSKLAPGVMAIPMGQADGDIIGTYPDDLQIAPGAVVSNIGQGEITQMMLAPNVTTPPSGPASGDLTGTYPDPLIAPGAVKTDRIDDYAVTNIKLADEAVDTRNIMEGAITQDLLDEDIMAYPMGPAGGDLDGTYPDPNVDGILGYPVQTPVENGLMWFDGSQWISGFLGNDNIGDNSVDINKLEAGDQMGEVIWWDNDAQSWMFSQGSAPLNGQVLTWDSNFQTVTWEDAGFTLPYEYTGATDNMTMIELNKTDVLGNGIEVNITDAPDAGSAIVATGGGDDVPTLDVVRSTNAALSNGAFRVRTDVTTLEDNASSARIHQTVDGNDIYDSYGALVTNEVMGTVSADNKHVGVYASSEALNGSAIGVQGRANMAAQNIGLAGGIGYDSDEFSTAVMDADVSSAVLGIAEGELNGDYNYAGWFSTDGVAGTIGGGSPRAVYVESNNPNNPGADALDPMGNMDVDATMIINNTSDVDDKVALITYGDIVWNSTGRGDYLDIEENITVGTNADGNLLNIAGVPSATFPVGDYEFDLEGDAMIEGSANIMGELNVNGSATFTDLFLDNITVANNADIYDADIETLDVETTLNVGSNFTVDAATGELTGTSATFTGDIEAVNGTFSGDVDAVNANLSGDVNATDANLTGNVNATDANLTGDANIGGDANVTGDVFATNGDFSADVNAGGDANITGDVNATDANLSGDANVTGDVFATNGDFSADVNAGGDANVTGDVNAGGDANITGDVFATNGDFSADVNAGGDANITGDVNATDANLSGDANVTGDVFATVGNFSSDVNAGGDANVTGDVNAGGDANVTGDVFATNGNFSNDVNAGGDANITGDVFATVGNFSSDVNAGGDANVTGDVNATDANLTGDANVGGDANVTGDVFATNGTFSGNISAVDANLSGDANVTGDANIGGDANITGDVFAADGTFDGTVTINETGGPATLLDINGTPSDLVYDLDLNGDANITGDADFGGDVNVIGDFNAQNVTATQDITAGSDISAGQDLTANGDLTIFGNSFLRDDIINPGPNNSGRVYVNDDFEVSGTTYLVDLFVDGDLTVTGTSDLQDAVTAGNGLTVEDDDLVVSTTAGTDFTVSAGDGTTTIGDQVELGNSTVNGNSGYLTLNQSTGTPLVTMGAFDATGTTGGLGVNNSTGTAVAGMYVDGAGLGNVGAGDPAGYRAGAISDGTTNASLIVNDGVTDVFVADENGDVTASNDIDAGNDITADQNITATNGNIEATNGSLLAPSATGDVTVGGDANIGDDVIVNGGTVTLDGDAGSVAAELGIFTQVGPSTTLVDVNGTVDGIYDVDIDGDLNVTGSVNINYGLNEAYASGNSIDMNTAGDPAIVITRSAAGGEVLDLESDQIDPVIAVDNTADGTAIDLEGGQLYSDQTLATPIIDVTNTTGNAISATGEGGSPAISAENTGTGAAVLATQNNLTNNSEAIRAENNGEGYAAVFSQSTPNTSSHGVVVSNESDGTGSGAPVGTAGASMVLVNQSDANTSTALNIIQGRVVLASVTTATRADIPTLGEYTVINYTGALGTPFVLADLPPASDCVDGQVIHMIFQADSYIDMNTNGSYDSSVDIDFAPNTMITFVFFDGDWHPMGNI